MSHLEFLADRLVLVIQVAQSDLKYLTDQVRQLDLSIKTQNHNLYAVRCTRNPRSIAKQDIPRFIDVRQMAMPFLCRFFVSATLILTQFDPKISGMT